MHLDGAQSEEGTHGIVIKKRHKGRLLQSIHPPSVPVGLQIFDGKPELWSFFFRNLLPKNKTNKKFPNIQKKWKIHPDEIRVFNMPNNSEAISVERQLQKLSHKKTLQVFWFWLKTAQPEPLMVETVVSKSRFF